MTTALVGLIGRARWTATRFLTDRATVYGEGATGAMDTAVNTDLRCSLQNVNVQPAPTGGTRQELAGRRRFYWDADYTLPDDAQVQVDGIAARWNVVTNTQQPIRDRNGTVACWACDVMEAGT